MIRHINQWMGCAIVRISGFLCHVLVINRFGDSEGISFGRSGAVSPSAATDVGVSTDGSPFSAAETGLAPKRTKLFKNDAMACTRRLKSTIQATSL